MPEGEAVTHAERVREAERAVIEAVIRRHLAALKHDWLLTGHEERNLEAATVALLALRAATCQTCGGTGIIPACTCGGNRSEHEDNVGPCAGGRNDCPCECMAYNPSEGSWGDACPDCENGRKK